MTNESSYYVFCRSNIQICSINTLGIRVNMNMRKIRILLVQINLFSKATTGGIPPNSMSHHELVLLQSKIRPAPEAYAYTYNKFYSIRTNPCRIVGICYN